MINELITAFITFFTVIDPIGTIPVFIAATASSGHDEKRKIARRATFISAGVLISFIVLGELVLGAMGIPLSTFQIAGGIVLFLFAITMIFGESKPEAELHQINRKEDKAVFPLAMPSLASPGAILAAILLTENSKNSILQQSLDTVMMLLVLMLAWICMVLSASIFRFIGNGGAAIISRVMGMILSAVAVSNVLEGIQTFFRI